MGVLKWWSVRNSHQMLEGYNFIVKKGGLLAVESTNKVRRPCWLGGLGYVDDLKFARSLDNSPLVGQISSPESS